MVQRHFKYVHLKYETSGDIRELYFHRHHHHHQPTNSQFWSTISFFEEDLSCFFNRFASYIVRRTWINILCYSSLTVKFCMLYALLPHIYYAKNRNSTGEKWSRCHVNIMKKYYIFPLMVHTRVVAIYFNKTQPTSIIYIHRTLCTTPFPYSIFYSDRVSLAC